MYPSIIALYSYHHGQHKRSDVVSGRFLKDHCFQYLVTTSGLGHIWSNENQKLKHSKMLCCLHTFGTRSALWSQLHFPQSCLSPPTAPDATFLGNTPPLFHRYCLAFVSSPTFCQHFSLLSSHLSLSLFPPSLCCISTEPLGTVGFP